MYKIIKNYRDNTELRTSFNKLAEDTFGLNFEDWYQNGYWTDKYNPYSIVKDGEVIANVSVNLMDMRYKGKVLHLIQLGTVMTKSEYRNQGLIRQLMNEIDADYEGKVDGMYLFGGDDVIDFYPKFGYRKSYEHQYSKKVSITNEASMKQVSMSNKAEWSVLEAAIHKSCFQGQFDMADNMELYMFYVSKFMQGNVYYDEALDCYAVAEIEDDELLLHAVFAANQLELDKVIAAFGENIRQVKLAFTPSDTTGFDCQELHVEDCTLFVKGEELKAFEEWGVMFAELSHA